MGFYKDPYSKFGQLTYEMWRAVRLVVDTGMHSMGWTRQQAIDFFTRQRRQDRAGHHRRSRPLHRLARPGAGLQDGRAEDSRSCATQAKRELGAAFDVRQFHDVVLGQGAVPLDVLERAGQRVGDRSNVSVARPRVIWRLFRPSSFDILDDIAHLEEQRRACGVQLS